MIINGMKYRDPTNDEVDIIKQYKNEWESEIDRIPPSDSSNWPFNERESNKPYRDATKRYTDKIIALLENIITIAKEG